MKLYLLLKKSIIRGYKNVKFHLFETDNVLIYWPNFSKGILLLGFALLVLMGHLSWYVLNYHSENRIWLNEDYYDYRVFTTYCQILLTVVVSCITFLFRRNRLFRKFMGWFIPLYFGCLLIYSAQTVGIYSPAAMAGIVNILLIGFVFYQPKVIYSIAVIVTVYVVAICYLTSIDVMPYAPLFSEQLNQSNFYKNEFWMKSMAILYIPILIVSALFFEILLSQWRRKEKRIETLSRVDSLTEVYNRRYVSDFLTSLYKSKDSKYSVILLDLDFFKMINDSYGHDAGDEVLRRVAKILKSSMRYHDVVGRFGGEEFILILPNQSLQLAVEIADRCRKAIHNEAMLLPNGEEIHVSASFGVAISEKGKTMHDVIREADQALYRAKSLGRNQVCFLET
ncbi:GGDEF domain-containing protein [Acinetobacter sp. 194]|uniref:GGDEF domain-containing protein n=1 Tax=Acinetobacter shaoyimingii TaxID=2715164 RepID=UPI00140C233A|nr:GGDEF domain-containing protein [Acinetobacter shaoyimingii]NHB58870.1 GGDEF domain-containing protein [Acinetobacter shaoyimingii]